MSNRWTHPPRVAEMQGSEGAYVFSELLLQKIWRRGEFALGAVQTTEGQSVRLISPGRWNRLGGPDFLEAKLELGGRRCEGDVELHLQAEDWVAHGHAADPAYQGVVLHVVLFPPPEGFVTRDGQGRAIPTVVLLPLLPHDLEAFAWDEAAEVLAGGVEQGWWAEWAELAPTEVWSQVRFRARQRWLGKVRQAEVRLRRLRWEAACHVTAMEIMGQRFNRRPMLGVAERWPLPCWRGADAAAVVAQADAAFSWRTQGVRPLNQPRRRLAQYASWAQSVPDWPERLWGLGQELVADAEAVATAEFRAQHGLTPLRQRWCDELCAQAVGGGRWDSLVCDGFLPLVAARGVVAAESWWWHWLPGEAPESLRRLLPALGLARQPQQPAAHGVVQGLLHWWWERERAEWLIDDPGTQFGAGSKSALEQAVSVADFWQ